MGIVWTSSPAFIGGELDLAAILSKPLDWLQGSVCFDHTSGDQRPEENYSKLFETIHSQYINMQIYKPIKAQ